VIRSPARAEVRLVRHAVRLQDDRRPQHQSARRRDQEERPLVATEHQRDHRSVVEAEDHLRAHVDLAVDALDDADDVRLPRAVA
jgi:hypothetical protein